MLNKILRSFFKTDKPNDPSKDQVSKEIEDYFKKYGNPDFDSIPDDILEKLNQSNFQKILLSIQEKFRSNEELFKYQYELVKKAIKINHLQYNLITRIDLRGYYHFYEKAMHLKKEGDIRKSASILCFNIIRNGTFAPGHYTELMVLLRKLKEYEKEHILANLYLKLFDRGVDERNKTVKRIITIEKLIAKK